MMTRSGVGGGCRKALCLVPTVSNSLNFSEAKFYENYLTSDFHTNTVISRRVCLHIKMASTTAIKSI